MSNPVAVQCTGAWQQVAASDVDFLITSRTLYPVEIGAFDGTAPSAADVGHWLDPRQGQGANRAVLGPGAVYVRGPAEATVIVKTWAS